MVRVILLAALGGCSIFNAPPDSYSDTAQPGAETEGPSTAPPDDDSDSTVGGDDTSSTGNALDCEQPVPPVPAPGECVKQQLTCGERLIDTTEAGTRVMTDEEYASWYCYVFPEGDYSGSERIYHFRHPGTGTVTIELDSPCADLDLFSFQWEYWVTEQTCPTASNTLNCDVAKGSGGGTVSIFDNSVSNYLIVVDGPEPVSDIFALSVTCP